MKRQGLSSPIKKSNKINPSELDLDDEMESINENIPKARAMELSRLREENAELKEKLLLLKE